MIKIFNQLSQLILKGDNRIVKAKKNIIVSFVSKFFSICISLALVPMTIGYLNNAQYGIWLTMSSVLGWFSYFDIGLTHGFRNKFAEAKAKGNIILARKYVSTTYLSMFVIFAFVYVIFLLINNSLVNWSAILSVDDWMENELKEVFSIVLLFFCLQMSLKPISTLIIADQSPAYASIIDTSCQLLCLLTVYILTKTSNGSLISLAYTISVIPVVVLLICSIFLFLSIYKDYKPSCKYFDRECITDILGLGGKFFFIQLSQILVFEAMNLIISYTQGPENVTIYNVLYKSFYVFNMIFAIILTPFWSAFTDAYVKNDYIWMKKVYKKLLYSSIAMSVIILFFLLISERFYYVWLNGQIQIPFKVAAAMAFYIISITLGCVPATLLNGLGKVKIQMIVHIIFAIITVPCLLYILNIYDLYIGLLFLSLNPLIHFIIETIQINKILQNKAYGIWEK